MYHFICLLLALLVLSSTSYLVAEEPHSQISLTPRGSFAQEYEGFPVLTAQGTSLSPATDVLGTSSGLHPTSMQRMRLQEEDAIYCSDENRSGVLMGSWDLNGDGNEQMVFNYGHYIKILQPDGSAKSYSIASRWALMVSAVCDMDGESGFELPFNTGSHIKIVKDKDHSTKSYNIQNGSWALMAACDTDGVPNNEIVCNIGGAIQVINHRTKKSSLYRIHSGSWALLSGGISDLDGEIGNELAFNIGGAAKVITDRQQEEKTYRIGIPWALVGIVNHDGKKGNEILYRRSGLWGISHRQKKTYFITSREEDTSFTQASTTVDEHNRTGNCPKCGGTGNRPVLCPHFKRFVLKCTNGCHPVTCETCAGSGSVPHHYQKCPRCKGRGMIGSCGQCGYVLWCSHGANWSICHTCEKTGIVFTKYKACPRCKGFGEISYCNSCGLKFLATCSHGVKWTGCGACDKGLILDQYNDCPRCRGRGEYIYCPVCRKEVLSCSHNSIHHYRTCGTCNKTGRISDQLMACPRCRGKGKTSYCQFCGKKFLASCSHGLKWTGCGACDKGVIDNMYFSCPRCDGRGEYMYCSRCQKEVASCSHNSLNNYRTCQTCNKTGRVSYDYKVCPVCKGSGKRGDGMCIVCSGKGVIENPVRSEK